MSPEAKRLGGFVRGFAAAYKLGAADLAELYFSLALEQFDRGLQGATSLDAWIEGARRTWQKIKGA